MPMAMTVIWLKLPPVIMLTRPSMSYCSDRARTTSELMPGTGITPTRRKISSIMKV